MDDARRAHRGRTYLGAKITFHDQYSAMNCLVRNVSPHGAKLAFSSSVVVPGEFDLAVRDKTEARRVRIVWRDKVRAGVVFLDTVGSNVISIDEARRAAIAEADRQILARRIKQVTERFEPK